MSQSSAVLFGQLSQHFDGRTKEMTDRFDKLMSALDHLLKQAETAEQEQTIVVHDQKLHRDWIGQLADATNTKLVPEQ